VGFTGLNTAVSGLDAAQTGLYVTGHNMANSSVVGYSRQRPVSADFVSQDIGESPLGKKQKGLGAMLKAIQQIRDRFLDASYRVENCRLGFYSIKAATGQEIERIMGETQSQYNFQQVLNDVWNSLNELAAHPEGVETRTNFLASCVAFVTKAEDVYLRLFEYQHNLDDQVRIAVADINSLVNEISTLSRKISSVESTGDHANDYRDQRATRLDELSKIINYEFREKDNGGFMLTCEGKELLNDGFVHKLGLKYTNNEYSFVEPVFTGDDGILPADTPVSEYEPLFVFADPVNAEYGNDTGSLKGMLLARGSLPANYLGTAAYELPDPAAFSAGANDPLYIAKLRRYNNDVFSVSYCFVPQVMNMVDNIVHNVVVLINDSVAPARSDGSQDPFGPYPLNPADDAAGIPRPYTEVFSRKFVTRWDGANNFNTEHPYQYATQYTLGNLQINPDVMLNGGYNLLAFSPARGDPASGAGFGDKADNRLLLNMISKWDEQIVLVNADESYSINDAYKRCIANIGDETSEDVSFLREQTLLVQQSDDRRHQIMGVSLDEEMKNMMIYQHAYSAAAKILNVIDSMMQTVIQIAG
jgi:flagellar hook-associated protein 1 FlgK